MSPPDLLRASGRFDAALEEAGRRRAQGAALREIREPLAAAATAAAEIFDPSAVATGLAPDGVEPDTSPRNAATLILGLYAGVVAGSPEPTAALARRGRPEALTELVTFGAELRRCALALAALLRDDPVEVRDDNPGQPAPDPGEARLWTAQADALAALAAGDPDRWRTARGRARHSWDALYADAPADDPEAALRLPMIGLDALGDRLDDNSDPN